MKTFSITDTGILRTINQDYCFSSDTSVGKLPNLYIICDGMGGHKAGEYASRYTVERIVASVTRSRWSDPVRVLREAIQKANEILVIEASENEEKQGMGTTVVAATIIDHKLHVANVGDSRLYVVNEQIEQITRDHSYVQEMVLRGEVAPEDARTHEKKNVITRAVGADSKIDIDFFEVELKDKDTVLLCTDGLTNMLTDDKIHQIIMTHVDTETTCKILVEEANRNGGQDNITATVIKPFYEEVKVC
ncbi:MAG: Stp1/IreP family PP2C-type Ser/Thr phosphatase [Agathobacter sp.]